MNTPVSTSAATPAITPEEHASGHTCDHAEEHGSSEPFPPPRQSFSRDDLLYSVYSGYHTCTRARDRAEEHVPNHTKRHSEERANYAKEHDSDHAEEHNTTPEKQTTSVRRQPFPLEALHPKDCLALLVHLLCQDGQPVSCLLLCALKKCHTSV